MRNDSKSNSVTAVTGASGALGTSVASHLVDSGRRVARLLRPASTEAGSAPDNAAGQSTCRDYLLEIGSLESWNEQLPNIESSLGTIRGAVLCAGGWAGGKSHHEDDGGTFRSMFDANLETAQVSLRALIPTMIRNGGGSIVAVGSRVAERPWESQGAAAYAASKAALVSLVQTTAQEVLAEGVRLNVVLPSVIDTPANRKAMPNADHASWVGTDQLARVIGFLLSDDASAVSGAAVPVYGRV